MIRVGFDASDLQPESAGVFTYGSQLLNHLALLPDAPRVTLLEGLTPGARSTGTDAVSRISDVGKARSHGVDAVLQAHIGIAELAGKVGMANAYKTGIRRSAKQLWRALSGSPRTCPWLLPARGRHLDLYHWSHALFMPMPGAANVMVVHDTISVEHPEWVAEDHAKREVRRLALADRYASRLIAVSGSTRRSLIRLLGDDIDRRIDVIPLAVAPDLLIPLDLNHRDDILHSYGVSRGSYVLYVGTLEPRKNLIALANGFLASLPEIGQDVKLMLAGRLRSDSEALVDQLRALGLGDRLIIPGRVPQDDLPALLSGARVTGCVSLQEGFGLPPLESMAVGTPVIVSNTSSLPEVVGDAGLLVDPTDVRDIAAAIIQAVNDDALHVALSRKGAARAAQFSWSKTAELTMESYYRALEAPVVGLGGHAR